MKLDVLPIGLFGENSYVLQDHDHVLLVDPGRFPDEIATHIPKVMPVDAIVLTHGHGARACPRMVQTSLQATTGIPGNKISTELQLHSTLNAWVLVWI